MPTYSYACQECGHQEDKFLRMSEFKTALPCPKCGKEDALQKVPNATGGFALKGNGYYVTDFKNKN